MVSLVWRSCGRGCKLMGVCHSGCGRVIAFAAVCCRAGVGRDHVCVEPFVELHAKPAIARVTFPWGMQYAGPSIAARSGPAGVDRVLCVMLTRWGPSRSSWTCSFWLTTRLGSATRYWAARSVVVSRTACCSRCVDCASLWTVFEIALGRALLAKEGYEGTF